MEKSLLTLIQSYTPDENVQTKNERVSEFIKSFIFSGLSSSRKKFCQKNGKPLAIVFDTTSNEELRKLLPAHTHTFNLLWIRVGSIHTHTSILIELQPLLLFVTCAMHM